MKPKSTILSVFTLILSVTLAPLAFAQSPDELLRQSEKAIKAEEWTKAHELLTKAVKRYDSRASALFGPKFGRIWYQKGRVELQLKKWKEVEASFTKCRGYPDNNQKFVGNLRYTDALAGKAEAVYQLKRYEEAAKLFRNYVAETKRAAALLNEENPE